MYVTADPDAGECITPASFLLLQKTPQLSLPAASELPYQPESSPYLPSVDPAEELRQTWSNSLSTLDHFWSIWHKDYLLLLRERSINRYHHRHSQTNIQPSLHDIVVVHDVHTPRTQWQLGRIVDLTSSHDGHIRAAKVQLANRRIVNRPLSHLYPLEVHNSPPAQPAIPAPVANPSQPSHRPLRLAAQQAQERLANLFHSPAD